MEREIRVRIKTIDHLKRNGELCTGGIMFNGIYFNKDMMRVLPGRDIEIKGWNGYIGKGYFGADYWTITKDMIDVIYKDMNRNGANG